jgi:thiol peroxidase
MRSALLILTFLMTISSPLWAKDTPIDLQSSTAGTSVSIKGEAVELYSGSVKIGDDFPALAAASGIDLPFNHKVTIVSTVPSIDTPVCELQTHRLGQSKDIAPQVDIITISRDLPMAQSRFSKKGKLKRVHFVSDYKTGAFGKQAGLMIRGRELLARAVIVLDPQGIVRYIQVVPEVSHLPDLKKAIAVANELVGE